MIFAKDRATLKIKIKQLEMLSLLRGRSLQQKIIEEEQNMPVTIDIREDIRYQQGEEQANIKTALKMLQNGVNISIIENYTGLDTKKLEELAKSLATN